MCCCLLRYRLSVVVVFGWGLLIDVCCIVLHVSLIGFYFLLSLFCLSVLQSSCSLCLMLLFLCGVLYLLLVCVAVDVCVAKGRLKLTALLFVAVSCDC